MNGNKKLSIEVSLIGSIAKKAGCSQVDFDHVHDLVDVIHRLEAQYPFLRTTIYHVDVNSQRIEKNLKLAEGDKVQIRPAESIN